MIQTRLLGEMIESMQPGFASGKKDEKGVLQVRMNNVTPEGGWDWSNRRYVPATEAQIDRLSLQAGDVLFNCTNSPEMVGKSAHFDSANEQVVFSNHFYRIRVSESDLHPSYLSRLLCWHFQRGTFRSMCNAWVNQATVRREDLRKLRVPLPPLPEQRRIAAILDQADALRAKRRAAIAKLDQLLQSVFLDMFGDPLMNPKRWPRSALKDLGQVQTGGTPPSSNPDMFNGSIPFVTPGDLGGRVGAASRTLTRQGAEKSKIAASGSTLVCCIGATIGKMGLATLDCAFNQQINAVTWGEQIATNYGYHSMRRLASEIAHRGASTTLPILKKSEFEKLTIPVPPMSLQKSFAVISEATAQQINAQTKSGAHLETLFASLRAKVFLTGEA